MMLAALALQAGPQASVFGVLRDATPLTYAVLAVLVAFSLISWWIIIWKAKVFREVRKQSDRFLEQIEKAQRLEDAYKAILALPDSPYGRVFRQGVNFFSELRPGSLRQGAAVAEGLSLTQLEALRMVLEKEEAEERDELARGLTWLAVIGSVAPGVGEALIATVVALAVAIPAVLFYNHFVGRLNLVVSELEGFSSEFIGTLAREGRI